MPVARTTVAIRQDMKSQLDQLQQAFETELGLPRGSLSPQVFLYASSHLGFALVKALEEARDHPDEDLTPDQIRQQAMLALEQLRSNTMLLQLQVSAREQAEMLQSTAETVAGGLLLLGLIAGAAALASKGGGRP